MAVQNSAEIAIHADSANLKKVEELEKETQRLREIARRIKAGEAPELVQQVIDSAEERVLTEQPELTPMEQYERLFSNIGNGNAADD